MKEKRNFNKMINSFICLHYSYSTNKVNNMLCLLVVSHRSLQFTGAVLARSSKVRVIESIETMLCVVMVMTTYIPLSCFPYMEYKNEK